MSCAIVKNNSPVAFLLFETVGSHLTLSCAWNGENKADAIPKMLLYALPQLRQRYPTETALVVQAANDTCETLVLKLVPYAQRISLSYYKSLQ